MLNCARILFSITALLPTLAFAINVAEVPTGSSVRFDRDVDVPANVDYVLLYVRWEDERELTFRKICTLSVNASGQHRVIKSSQAFVVAEGSEAYFSPYYGKMMCCQGNAIEIAKEESPNEVVATISVNEDEGSDYGLGIWSRRCGFDVRVKAAVDF